MRAGGAARPLPCADAGDPATRSSPLSDLFDDVARRLEAARGPEAPRPRGRTYRCRCGRPVFFRNSVCLGCAAPLGFEPLFGDVRALAPAGEPGLWQLEPTPAGGDPAMRYRRCANFESPAGCNWLVAAADPNPLCVACRLNRTIPDLADADSARWWAEIEVAKRRLVSQLVALRLPVASKVGEDPERGLAFAFLRAAPGGPPVLTGHTGGLVTLNVEEADDARRERIRQELHEPYRTLLGHLRHEVGHYYWDRLVAGTAWHEPFRARFGDERADYAAALRRHYEGGPPPDWRDRHISSYAAAHPWEDWAETWAHYLHMVDSLDTALGFGLGADDLESEIEPFGPGDLHRPEDPGAAPFLSFLNAWIELTTVLNELSRSMGQRDFYPFVMSRPVVAKLHFVHLVARGPRPGS